MKSPVWLKFQIEEAEEKKLKERAVQETDRKDGKGWWGKWLRRAILKALES